MKRWPCFIAALAFSLCCLAGCGATAETPEGSPAAETAAPEETAAPSAETGTETETGTEAEAEPGPGFEAVRDAFAPDTVVMTVDGTEIDWSRYSSAVFQYLYTFYAYYGITDYSLELEEGVTLADMAKDYAYDTLSSNAMFHSKAAELGVALSEEDLASIDEEIAYYAALYFDGDTDALFADAGITEGYYRYQAEAMLLYDAILEHYYGVDCADFPAEDALAWAEDNGYIRADHILFKTVDDNYDKLDDETVAEKRAQAEEALDALRRAAPSVREDLYEALMLEHSEDPGLTAYPDGYYFVEGDMDPAFYEAAAALEIGEISDIVEGFYGYHIIRRLALDPDQTVEYDSNTYQPVTLRALAATEMYENMLEEWYEAQDVRYAGDFEALDIAALFPAAETGETGAAEGTEAAETAGSD